MNSDLLRIFALSVSILALTSCDSKPKEQAVKSFESVDACKADIAQDATDEERQKVTADCSTAYEQSVVEQEKTATRYNTLGQCVDMYGPDRCGLARDGNGYIPAMSGFFLGYVAGAATYHPYYYDRWHTVYSGGSNLGYYRGGYVVAPSGSTWARSYHSVTINKGAPPPSIASTRGGFGGSAARSAGGVSVSNSVSPSGRGSSGSISAPSSPSARGGFGASAAHASGGSGG